MNAIDMLVRPNIRNLKPYSSARSLYQRGTFFDANEAALDLIAPISGFPDLNRYPDPYARTLREKLATFVDVASENIFVGNGSDEAIDLIMRVFVNPDESVVVFEPTYGMYRVAADTAGVKVASFPLGADFQIDTAALWQGLPKNAKLMFICSPNNPTGNLMRKEDVREICEKFSGIVVLDEAYIEFAEASSMAQEIAILKNLVVLRTFSKAWGLAGIRVGYAVADSTVIEYLDKVKAPYNVNRVSQELALRALANVRAMRAMRDAALSERARLEKELPALGFTVFPSDANFLLVRRPGASRAADKLANEEGLIVRDFGGKPALTDSIRMSVGTPDENNRLLAALKKRL